MRYQRQEKIIGKKGQQQLAKKHIVIVGVGAIGSVVAELATRAGIGSITLIDRDIVELNNLQRQVLFTEQDVGLPKAHSAAMHLKKINAKIKITAHTAELTASNSSLLKAHLILDCTDNFATRFLINEYAAAHTLPWIYAGAIRIFAAVFPALPGKACFRCFQQTATEGETCEQAGVLATATMTAATLQFTLAMKILLGEKVKSVLQRVDVWHDKHTSILIKKRKDCPVIKQAYEYLTQKEAKGMVVKALCGGTTYQIKGNKIGLTTLTKKLEKKGKVNKNKNFLQYKNLLVFADGRVIIQTTSEKKALQEYKKLLN